MDRASAIDRLPCLLEAWVAEPALHSAEKLIRIATRRQHIADRRQAQRQRVVFKVNDSRQRSVVVYAQIGNVYCELDLFGAL